MRQIVTAARTFAGLVAVAATVTLLGGPGAASSSNVTTTIGEWQTVASSGRQLGLSVDRAGNLLGFSQPGQLDIYTRSQLITAMAGVPVSGPAQRLVFRVSRGRQIAGIATSTSGMTYFDTGSSSTIWTWVGATHTLRSLPFPSNPMMSATGMVLSPGQHSLYVADDRTGKVYRVSLADLQVSVVFKSPGDRLESLVMDQSGNLDVTGLSGAVYSISAASLANTGAVAEVGHGAVEIANLGPRLSANGLAVDARDNLYVSTCVGLAAPHPAISVITHTATLATMARRTPATVGNGGVVPIADTRAEPSFQCIEPLDVSGGVLYAGDWLNSKIWGLPLRDLGNLVDTRTSSGPVQLTRTASTLLATWSARSNAIDYVCTLMRGEATPTSIRETTYSTGCWFGGLTSTERFGVRVVAYGSSTSVVGYAPAPRMSVLTCRRGSLVRRVQSYAPRCPSGYVAQS